MQIQYCNAFYHHDEKNLILHFWPYQIRRKTHIWLRLYTLKSYSALANELSSSDSLWVGGDKAVRSTKKPLVRDDRGTANMAIGLEVKADLPGPLPELSVLPSYDAVQLVRPRATVCHSTWNIIKEE